MSGLFPYRELHAVTFFGDTVVDALKLELNSSDLTRRVRSAAALAILGRDNTSNYEGPICDGLKHGGKVTYDALFALRFFEKLQNDECKVEILKCLNSNDQDVKILAVKIFFGRDGLRRGTVFFAELPSETISTTSVWDEVYYAWHP